MPDLRTALESAIKENEESTSTPQPAAPATEAAPAEGQTDLAAASAVDAPADSGAEVSAPEKAEGNAEPAPAKADEQKQEAQASGDTADNKEAAKQHRVDRPPQSWKGQAKGEWGQLPLHVRQEVQRREMEINRALQEAAPARQIAEQLNQVVSPFQARIRALGEPPMQVIHNLLSAELTLATAPKMERAQMMAKLIKDYGVDIEALDTVLAGQQAPQQQQSPDIAALVQQQVQQAIAPIFQQQQQARQQQALHTIETMSLDPKYPFFEDVRNDMADLIEMKASRGIDLSLEDAYAMAVRLNPEVNAQLERQTVMQSANQQHQQAQRAKAAASSVTGAPSGGGSFVPQGDGSLRGAIEAAFGGARL